MKGNPSQRNKRLVFMISGITDILIGAVILLIGFGLLPIDITDYGIPRWPVVLVGALMFIMGAWMAAYHYSRLDE
ncbi:MAG: hypothetical protein ACXW4M_14790 [Anaerolineales bacterium]